MIHTRAAALLLVLALACGDRPGTFRPTPIKDELRRALALGPGARASLDSLGPDNWRTMYLFGPYATTDVIRSCATPTGGFETHGIEGRDDLSVLWFRSETGRISSMTLGQDVAFTKEALNREYTRGSASFQVRRSLENARNELAPTGGQTRSCR